MFGRCSSRDLGVCLGRSSRSRDDRERRGGLFHCEEIKECREEQKVGGMETRVLQAAAASAEWKVPEELSPSPSKRRSIPSGLSAGLVHTAASGSVPVKLSVLPLPGSLEQRADRAGACERPKQSKVSAHKHHRPFPCPRTLDELPTGEPAQIHTC